MNIMNKVVLALISAICLFAACKKDKNRTAGTYGQGIDSMKIAYNRTYILYINRNFAGISKSDSDRIIFNPNGSITEISNRFDSSSYTFPDTISFSVNTSFDNGIYWNQISGAMVLNFYPSHDTAVTGKHFLFYDYLRNGTVSLFRSAGYSGKNTLVQVTHSLPDSVSIVNGYIQQ